MPWKKKLSRTSKNPYREALDQARLYLILDTEVQTYDSLFEIAKQAVTGGVDILQLRDKKGSVRDILKFSRKLLEFLLTSAKVMKHCGSPYLDLRFPNNVVPLLVRRSINKKFLAIPFIMNDRVDVALACGASGVHLGQEDLPVSFARKVMGPEAIIGASCQNFKQAKRAEQEGADYIGFGSVFKTKTKPHRLPMDLKLLEEVLLKIKIPVFAIGGIDQENILTLRQIGVQRVAVCRAICEVGDVIKAVKFLMK